MRLRSLLARRAVLAAAGALAIAACVPVRESRIAKGELIETGDESYDALFLKLRDTIQKTEEIDGEGPLRKQLATAMDLPEDAAAKDVINTLSDRSHEAKRKGAGVSLSLAPEPKVGGKAEWAGAVEAVLKDGVKRADELAALAKELEALEPERAQAYAEVDAKLKAAGIPLAKIREAKKELEAAREVLAQRQLTASNESGRAARFTLRIARAVDVTAAASPAPPAPAPSATEKPLPPWARKRPGGGRPAGRPAGAPPPRPPPKPPKGDDFDP